MNVPAFFEIVVHPEETMRNEKKRVNMDEANKTVAIYGAVIGLLIGLLFAVVGGIIGVVAGAALQSVPLGGVIAGLGFLAIIIMPVLGAIFALIGSHIFYHIIHFSANLLGGRGKFEENFYLGSRLLWPLLAANIIVNLLNLIPVIGQLAQLVWFFYTIYLFVILASVANNLDKIKGLLSFIVGIIVIGVIGFVIALIIGIIAAMVIVPAVTG